MIRVKVCGMRDPVNVPEVTATGPDYLGYIFYPASKRYVGSAPDPSIFRVPVNIKKVGVFANEEPGKIIETVRQHGLNIVQLHGDESIKDCRMIKSAGCRIIKAFGIDDRFRFKTLKPYLELCDYFLLDTRSEKFGGTGKQFNWERIQDYHYDVPFFLSGGICYEDARRIRELEHPAFFAVDINSRFEREAGVKDINLVKGFIDEMKGLKT